MEQKEFDKQSRAEEWYRLGLDVGFTPKQLDFLKDYFAFWSDVPKTIEDLY